MLTTSDYLQTTKGGKLFSGKYYILETLVPRSPGASGIISRDKLLFKMNLFKIVIFNFYTMKVLVMIASDSLKTTKRGKL